MKINELITDGKTYGADTHALSPEQLQVKSLKDKSKQLNIQAKKVSAQQNVQKAQAKLNKISQSSLS
jgi:hypothetical protein